MRAHAADADARIMRWRAAMRRHFTATEMRVPLFIDLFSDGICYLFDIFLFFQRFIFCAMRYYYDMLISFVLIFFIIYFRHCFARDMLTP